MEIYSHINDLLFAERVKMFSLLAGTTAAVAILIVFLIKWSSLNEEVKRRGKELEEANKELEAANKQLSFSNEQLKVHDKAQQEFINVAAHELRTPIQPIISLSDVLIHKLRDNENVPLLDIISRNARKLQRLSQDILDVTKIESGLLKLNKERFDLKQVISNIINDYRRQIKDSKRNIRLTYGFDKEQEEIDKGTEVGEQQQEQHNKQLRIEEDNDAILVEADRGRITQVIDNLLSNSIKFTNIGDICISINKKDGWAIISVKDNGHGIDPSILPKLFTKFASKPETGGTGLGLFISKNIVEAHSGKIWAQNNDKEKGATFYFSLPLLET